MWVKIEIINTISVFDATKSSLPTDGPKSAATSTNQHKTMSQQHSLFYYSSFFFSTLRRPLALYCCCFTLAHIHSLTLLNSLLYSLSGFADICAVAFNFNAVNVPSSSADRFATKNTLKCSAMRSNQVLVQQ